MVRSVLCEWMGRIATSMQLFWSHLCWGIQKEGRANRRRSCATRAQAPAAVVQGRRRGSSVSWAASILAAPHTGAVNDM